MYFLLDAYNVIFRSHYPCHDLENARNILIRNILQASKSSSLKIKLIFDAHCSPEELRRHHLSDLEIVYTATDQTADHYIIELVECSANPAKLCVVSSDKGLIRICRQLGSHTKDVGTFEKFLRKKVRAGSKSKTTIHKPAPSSDPLFDYYLKIFEEKLDKDSSEFL